MIETATTRQMHQAIENAHKERAEAFKGLFQNWFGLKGLMPHGGHAHHA